MPGTLALRASEGAEAWLLVLRKSPQWLCVAGGSDQQAPSSPQIAELASLLPPGSLHLSGIGVPPSLVWVSFILSSVLPTFVKCSRGSLCLRGERSREGNSFQSFHLFPPALWELGNRRKWGSVSPQTLSVSRHTSETLRPPFQTTATRQMSQ